MYTVLIEEMKKSFPSVVDGPAGPVFAEDAEITRELVVDGMAMVDMVILHRRGANPYRNAETKQHMIENDWYSGVTDEELEKSQKVLASIFALMKGK